MKCIIKIELQDLLRCLPPCVGLWHYLKILQGDEYTQKCFSPSFTKASIRGPRGYPTGR